MKRSEINRRQYSDRGQWQFDKKYACWANNHNGWSKMKKLNRKLFKKKFRRETEKEVEREMNDVLKVKDILPDYPIDIIQVRTNGPDGEDMLFGFCRWTGSELLSIG